MTIPNPAYQVGEMVKISDLIYDDPSDLEAIIVDYNKTIDEVDGGYTYEYELITEKLGNEITITERFLRRI
ncbi:MAG TPA: hypothetical protein V6C58_09025 [Allocoleopsis sp.]